MSREDFDLNQRLYRLSKILSDAEIKAVEMGIAELDEDGFIRPVRRTNSYIRPVYIPEYIITTNRSVYRQKVSKYVTILYVASMLSMLLMML